jgi:hypothetical protein
VPQGNQVDAAAKPGSGAVKQNLPAMTRRHHPRSTVQHRTEVIRPRNSASPVANPIRTGN